MTADFYDLLEIPSDASQDEIKAAYREKVRIYHPDLNDDDRAQAQFTAVKKGYDILSDPVERKAYDRLGHETYVAKRTSGIPSPDVWKTDDDGSSGSDRDETDDTGPSSRTTSTSRSRTTSTSDSSSTTAGSGSDGSTRSKTASAGGASTGASSTTAGTGASAGATGTGAGSTTAGRKATGDRGASASGASTETGRGTGSSDGGRGRESARSRTADRTETGRGRLRDTRVARWWRRRNFGLPLIWLSVLVYVAGLAHFALEHDAALEALGAEVAAVGPDPDGLRSLLTSGRHGLETTVGFVARVELVTPPVEPIQWYGGLAGAVGLTVAVLVVARLLRAGDARRPLTIDETIVIAGALAATTTVVGGPLLAGAVLMPFLFGIIVRRTRRSPGWKPSYLYVLPVLAPAAGFAAAAAGHATLAVDLVAFVLLPLAGALGLALRVTIRKRFGR